MPNQRYELNTESANLRYGTHGYEMDAMREWQKL